MPSDPSGVHPSGVLVRPAPDFFDDNLACAGFQTIENNPMPSFTYWSIGLFNNDTQGRVYKVYGISVSTEGGGGLVFFPFFGHLGTQKATALPTRFDAGAPTGQIFVQEVTGSAAPLNPFDIGPDMLEIAAGGFDSGTTVSPFPLAIIPRGYSLIGCNPASTQVIGCFFWYQIANE